MGRWCTTCKTLSGRELDKVNRELVKGQKPLAALARETGLSVDTLRHHRASCVHKNLRKAEAARQCDYAEELWGVFTKSVNRLGKNIDDLEVVIEKTKSKRHFSTLIKALAEVRGTLELSYKMMASMSAAQTAQEDIDILLHRGFENERIAEILQDLTTSELKVLHKVFAKITQLHGEAQLIDQESAIIDVEPIRVSDREEEDNTTVNTYEHKMVRTTTPGNYDSEKNHDSTPAAQPSGLTDAETLGAAEEEDAEPVDPLPAKTKWRPPLHTIHFTDAQSFIGYLYGRKRRQKF